MKKFFLLFSAVLLLGSCTDLGVSEEDAIKDALPKDFGWEVYAELNSDVKMSQIIFMIRDEKGEVPDTTKSVRENCVDVLKADTAFAREIYLDYAGCPKLGWDRNKKCTGKYANNSSYTTDTTCNIGACWHGGWDSLGTAANFDGSDKCGDIEFLQENPDILAKCDGLPKPLYSFLLDSLNVYNTDGRRGGNQISLMCKFVPLAGKSHLKELESKIDPMLVELHYVEFGRHDGRPYKECKPGKVGVPRTIDLASKKQSDKGVYYDYGEHLFCLNKSDWKIYTTEEE